MNPAALEQIVHAVLYEGYILYPYRPSSSKNRRERFTFGRIYPRVYSVAQKGAEPCVLQTECLVQTRGPAASVSISARFLQPMARESMGETWHEAVERTINAPPLPLAEATTRTSMFLFPGSCEAEPVRRDTLLVGMAVRRQEPVEGTLSVSATPLGHGLFRISVRIENNSRLDATEINDPAALLLRLFASTHVVLQADQADFISLMDPPAALKEAAAACQNIGVWPVLAGDEAKGERDTMLCSPIILYDYPKIAAESAGNLFDGTEIDEILTLRILTMTDAEKSEMRRVDEQARRLLERTETLSTDALLKMHGTMRGAAPEAVEFDDFFGANTKLAGVTVHGVWIKAGDRVRLRPKARADAMDMMLAGQEAIVEAVEQDLEKRVHLAVVLENDPGQDLGWMRQPGHRFFYGVDEVEPMTEALA
ncbi:MAG TPA: hypothetical protein VHB20_03250 [Verrucomicrobiae bacterium]|jgi:hydrogenase maturation protease|nr:hypothetical protein [Verrucomicrobiae bacterium]